MEEAESFKAKGNKHFQKNELNQAITSYTTAFALLEKYEKTTDALLLQTTLLSNRAMCHLKLYQTTSVSISRDKLDEKRREHLDQCIQDCTDALDILDSKNLPSSSSSSKIRMKILYRRAKAKSIVPPSSSSSSSSTKQEDDETLNQNLNSAARDLLDILSLEPNNKEAASLLQSIKIKHGMMKDLHDVTSPLSKALSTLQDLMEQKEGDQKEVTKDEEDMTKNKKKEEMILHQLKIILGVLNADTVSSSMELGRKKNGIQTLFSVAKLLRGSYFSKCRTRALQALSIACSSSMFVEHFVNKNVLDGDDLVDVMECELVQEGGGGDVDVAVACIGLMLRLVMHLNDEDDEKEEKMKSKKTLVGGNTICRMCQIALSSTAMNTTDVRPQRAALDLLSAWTTNDKDSVLLAAEEASGIDIKKKQKKKSQPTDDEIRQMKPRELAAYKKKQYEITQQNRHRVKDNVTLFLRYNALDKRDGEGSDCGGLNSLLTCATTTQDYRLRREVGVMIGRLISTLSTGGAGNMEGISKEEEEEAEYEIKCMVKQILGCTKTILKKKEEKDEKEKEHMLTIEEITEDDEEEKQELKAKGEEKATDAVTKQLEIQMQRGQLTSSLLLGKSSIGVWALKEGWSDGDAVNEITALIYSNNNIAMSIASELASAAASTEHARPYISPLVGAPLEALLESDSGDVRSGAASAMAKLGLANKELSDDEGEVMGLLQVAVELLNEVDDDNNVFDDKDAKAKQFLDKQKKNSPDATTTTSTTIERGIELLSYLASKTQVKEELTHDFRSSSITVSSSQSALDRLVELSCSSSSSIAAGYGLATIFSLLAVSSETLRREQFEGKEITPEQYDELQNLGKTEEEKEFEAKSKTVVEDSPDAVNERIRKMASCNVPRAMVKLMEHGGRSGSGSSVSGATSSEHTMEQLVVGMNRMALEESVRGTMVQQGCLSALLKVEEKEKPTDSEKKTLRNARHCIAKMLVTTNPSLLTISQRMGSIRPLIQLVRDHESNDLQQFEALLSLTNLASVDDETKGRIVAEKGIATLSYAMYSDHEMVRRAATEAMMNMVPHPTVMEQVFANDEKLKIWLAFALDYEENFECARAAAGGIAMASRDPRVAKTLSTMKSLDEMIKTLLECGNLEMMHRVLVVILNMMEHGEECKEKMVSCGAVAFCSAYADSYHDGSMADSLGFSDADRGAMKVTVDLAKEIVRRQK